jgi:uncharacterized SAM-binding protein YcdF (DUF218 family)
MKNRRIELSAILIAVSVIAWSCAFTAKGGQRMYRRWAEGKSYDMIVVPGIPFYEDSLQWGWIMRGRVYWAKFLYDKGIAKNIMFSGSAVYSPYYEAEIMALYAAAIGIPKEHIFTETKAEHSTENLYYSYKKSKQLGFNTIALASDPYQSKQLRLFAHLRLSRHIGIIPFVIDTLKQIEPEMKNPEINYKQAYKKNFVPLPERESKWERFKGTMGLNIDKQAYKN